MSRGMNWLVAAVVGGSAGVAGAGIVGGPFVNPANGHTYYLLDAYRNPSSGWNAIGSWFDSEAEAVSLGGHLVTINDAAENDWVFDTFWSAAASRGAKSLWLGLNDAGVEGTWAWSSGQAVTYMNWQPGQPQGSRSDEDYVGMDWSRMWHDIVDGDLFGDLCFGVVEIDSPTIPLPSAATLAIVGLVGMAGRHRPHMAPLHDRDPRA